MSSFGLWQVSDSRPIRVEAKALDLERNLQNWIQETPELVLSGLRIIGSEVRLDGGRARADLLGIDIQGRLTIIELKRGPVFRDTVAQALDYAACIEDVDGETLRRVAEDYLGARGSRLAELVPASHITSLFDRIDREIHVMVVGVGQEPALSRLLEFLNRRSDLDLSVVSFQVYEVGNKLLLGREVTEPPALPQERTPSQARSMDAILSLAARNGTADHLNRLLKLAEELGLPARPYKYSVMFTPPNNRTRVLFTVSVQSPQRCQVYTLASSLREFYSVPEDEARARLGPDGWHDMSMEEVEAFAATVKSLIEPGDAGRG